MSVARVHSTVIAPGTLAATTRVPLAVEGLVDWVAQWVQTANGGTATAEIYGSALQHDDQRLEDTDPATNPHWELDTLAVWAAPGAIGAGSVRAADNAWSTILVVIDVTAPPLPGFAVYFFGKER